MVSERVTENEFEKAECYNVRSERPLDSESRINTIEQATYLYFDSLTEGE